MDRWASQGGSAGMTGWGQFRANWPLTLTLQQTAEILERTGLTDIQIDDRNQWCQGYVRQELARMAGPDCHRFDALLGKEETEAWIAAIELKAVGVTPGQIRPGHLRARRP